MSAGSWTGARWAAAIAPEAIGGRARAAFDRAERLALAVARRRPRAGLVLAGGIGASRHGLSQRWPEPAALAKLFGIAPPSAARLARRIAAQEARNRLVSRLRAECRGACLRRLVSWATEPSALPAPALFVTFHVGALPALGLGLDRLPGPWLAAGCGELEPEALAAPDADGVQRRAALLGERLAHLRGRGCVVLAADGELGGHVPIHCLGRPLPLRRGTFFLARQSGVPVAALVALWRGARVELAAERLSLSAPTCTEAELAAALGEWLSRFLRARPEALTVGLQRRLCGEI